MNHAETDSRKTEPAATTPCSAPEFGPCMHCEETTHEGRFWLDGDGDEIPGEWCWCHERCHKLSAMRLEEVGFRKLRENPDDPTAKVVCGILSALCDRALGQNAKAQTPPDSGTKDHE